MARFKFKLSIGLLGCTREEIVEVEDDELDGLNEADRNSAIQENWQDWAGKHIESEWEELNAK